MKTFTYSDMNRTPGEILDIALVEPVMLTKRGKDKIAIMSADVFDRLPYQQAYTIQNAPEDVHQELVMALEDAIVEE